ncbi:metallophosphoesterase family protein [Pseudovibrio sp. Alg231-02]|uniref:metallophosphoesterase family protein n=1 Tax=Pseudovibrio sp. Alg231-02 TaxID=1922223 RepID=UPI000D5605AE|nr:metallophosphoesterase [Pseudovibrio sp. Alg231-02]
MRFLVVSDIHCMSSDLEGANVYFGNEGSSFNIEERCPSKNPILALTKCLSDEELQVDAILCLGDFAHQSKQLPLMQAWNDLHHVAQKLDIQNVIGVTGNHDLLSRIEDIDQAQQRIDFLKQIAPPFPFNDSQQKKDYFADGVAVLSLSGCDIIAVDTCRLHGLGGDANASRSIWSIGYLSEAMIAKIIELIEQSENSHFIVMMHHHPLRVDEILDSDYDQMADGAKLLQALGDTGKSCVVVHGHKHMVKLRSAELGQVKPIVFSASSFAAYPYRNHERYFANQFHILDFNLDVPGPEGTIYSWDWGGGKWERSKTPNMPYTRPFGKDYAIDDIVAKICTIDCTSMVAKSVLFESVPELAYVSTDEVEVINKKLIEHDLSIVSALSDIQALIRGVQ